MLLFIVFKSIFVFGVKLHYISFSIFLFVADQFSKLVIIKKTGSHYTGNMNIALPGDPLTFNIIINFYGNIVDQHT